MVLKILSGFLAMGSYCHLSNQLLQEEKIILKIQKQKQEIKTILNKDHVQGLKF